MIILTIVKSIAQYIKKKNDLDHTLSIHIIINNFYIQMYTLYIYIYVYADIIYIT